MDEEAIRAEITRRKQRAIDLKLRETIWSLYSSELKYAPEQLVKDREIVLPEIRESLTFDRSTAIFAFSGEAYQLSWIEGKTETESDGYGRGREETSTTPIGIDLATAGNKVFALKVIESVRYTREMPLFYKRMGDITAFIEGKWITAIPSLLVNMQKHREAVWEIRRAPDVRRKLEQDKANFGL